MSNSVLRNPSINFITESKVKTLTSIDENNSYINEPEHEEDFTRQVQINQISRWKHKKQQIPHPYISTPEQDQSKPNAFYLLRVDDIIDIPYKRTHTTHKLYLEIAINLFDHHTSGYLSRSLKLNITQLQSQTSTHSHHKLTQPFNIYFYTKQTANLSIIIDAHICQSTENNHQEIMQHRTYLGYAAIDPFKGIKSKQKINFTSKRNENQLEAIAQYAIIVSDSMKILQKLIPPHCLCNAEDLIGGLSGRRLPNYQINSIPQLQFTELFSLRSDFASIDVADSLLEETLRSSQLIYRHLVSPQSVNASIKELRLQLCFHNGWTVVNETSLPMRDKMEIQKKMGTSSKKKTVVKYHNYTCDEVGMLPFIFMDQEAILIMQIVARVEIKTKQPKQAQKLHNSQIPICYCYYVIDKQLTEQRNIRQFIHGIGLNGRVMAEIQPMTQTQIGTRKTIVDEVSFLGKIQFYIQLDPVNKIHFSKQNVSMVNKSMVEVDKVKMEKERMIKENKKLKLQNRKKKIQMNQEIPLLDTTEFKQNAYLDEVQKLRHQRMEKEEMLTFLKHKLKQFQYLQDQPFQTINPNIQSSELYPQSNQGNMFHQTNINRNSIVDTDEEQTIINIPNNFTFRQPTYALLGQVPLEVIKTQLIEKNYTYGFFINWMSFIPLNHSMKLPRKFFFTLKLFTSQTLQSPLFCVEPSTGQIQLAEEEEDKTKKVIFIEFPPLPDVQNFSQKFIEFIGYLYHCDVQIKVIDHYSKIQFGECYFRLKDLIRMRRNDVVVVRDLILKKGTKIKAKLKVQIKCIRKEYEERALKKEPVDINKIQELSLTPEERQKKRIERYKKARDEKKQDDMIKSQKIEKILMDNYVLGESKLYVNRMKSQFVWIQLTNHKNYVQEFKININDPDKNYNENEELVLVNQIMWKHVTQSRWWKYLDSIGHEKHKVKKLKIPLKDKVELEPSESVFLLFYYFTERKYEGQIQYNQYNFNLESKDILRVYNHQRVINITFTNQNSKALVGIYKLNIVPQSDFSSLAYSFSRKTSEKVQICLPFSHENNFVLYIDDHTVIANENIETNKIILDCYSGQINSPKQVQVSILSPAPEHRMLLSYSFTLWGAQQIYIQGQLWQPIDFLLDFHSSMGRKEEVTHVIALGEDERIISIKDKNPIKINTKQAKTLIRGIFTPKEFGINYYELNLVHPESYEPLYRYVLKANILRPEINEQMTLRLKLTDKIIQQPFSFRNEQARKLKYSAFSTREEILWCAGESFEVEAKSEAKIKIKINAEIVTRNERVILCLKSSKVSFYYQFNLVVDDHI